MALFIALEVRDKRADGSLQEIKGLKKQNNLLRSLNFRA